MGPPGFAYVRVINLLQKCGMPSVRRTVLLGPGSFFRVGIVESLSARHFSAWKNSGISGCATRNDAANRGRNHEDA